MSELRDVDLLVDYTVPYTYKAGDYDFTIDDPERAYWGNYSKGGNSIRREASYFVAGSAEDEYFIEQMKINDDIKAVNDNLAASESSKHMTYRFLFSGDTSQMADRYGGSPYVVYLSGEGTLRLFIISNGKLSVKRSRDYYSWYYDIYEEIIHKNYVDDNLNKGYAEEISNVQVVRNDYDKSLISLLYFNNSMLFIRHFYTNSLFSWYDSEGKLHDEEMRSAFELIDGDLTTTPPTERTKNVPIFLVGVIPEGIKKTIIYDIDNNISSSNSELFTIFPYKDPDDPSNKEKNKEMVNRFNEDFALDLDTQVYSITTAKGLIRIFYRDSFGNIDGILLDNLNSPTLEVMNVFKGTI